MRTTAREGSCIDGATSPPALRYGPHSAGAAGVLEVPLTRGMVALIDASDEPLVSQYKWHATESAGRSYAAAVRDGRRVLMHRLILGFPETPHVDHKNGNGLDNRRDNIRPATVSQNQANRSKQIRPAHSRFKGVSFHKRDGLWQAHIRAKYIGNFTTEVEAAQAYNAAAIEAFGEFARLNEIPTLPASEVPA